MRLADLVKIDHRFEKSVNLLLDLNDESKLKLYIPTRSSIKLLTEYLTEVDAFSGKRANILIGPYGKGKSHLLLVLLAILSGNDTDEMKQLIERIGNLDGNAKEKIERVYRTKKLLPVIINTSSGELSQAFVRSLNQALKREKLADIVPDNYFSKALFVIAQWEKHYPATYDAFKKTFQNHPETVMNGLEVYDYDSLNKFKEVYPTLTSGSEFNPEIEDDVLTVYRSVNKQLCSKHGYDGIYIIFDEFSKYIEGHRAEGFSADMKTLQDLCELCNSSEEEQFHLTCVAHKAIRSYGDSLSKEVKNAFLGVEGRLNEMRFIVSSQNNYELIADAIQKKIEFDKWSVETEAYQSMLDHSYQVQELRTLFNKKDFDEIVGRGAFPLTPLSACLLLRLSEKIAQNERTLFTFLTGKDLYSLATYVERCSNVEFSGAPLIYDYFSQLLEEEKDLAVHREWLNAENAIGKTEDEDARKILKAIAVIRMINQPGEFPANAEFLYLASGLEKEHCENAIALLCRKKIVTFKENDKSYDFHDSIGVDLQEIVSDCVKKQFANINASDVLNRINKQKYILPKKYNQDHCMTRYFQVHIMNSDSFMALSSITYLQKENDPDGYLILILNNHKEKQSAIKQHLEELRNLSVMAAIVEPIPHVNAKAQKLLGVQKLLLDQNFIKENAAAAVELETWKKSLIDELNSAIAEIMNHITTLYTQNGAEKIRNKCLNRAVSDIAEFVYNRTPLINHELINRHNITAQTSKARNIILEDIFHSRQFEQYRTGTSAESTIYRACLGTAKEDENLSLVRREITEFIHESKGRKNVFASLVNKLTKAPYGMRRGVLPIYIAEQIMQLEDMPVIYHDKTEVALSPKLIVDAVVMPKNHYLYVETETVEKLEYIEGLEKLFSEYGNYCREIENMNRLARLKCFMQAWYRSLPQAAITFQIEDYPRQDMQKLKMFRKALAGEPNPRELIFEKIPCIFETDSLLGTLKKVKDVKKDLDGHTRKLKKEAERVLRTTFGLSKNDDLLQSLKAWYEDVPEKAKYSILPVTSQSLLNCIRDASGNNEGDLIEKIAKMATNFFIEDWNDKILSEFETVLKALVSDLQQREKTVSCQNKKISVSTNDGIKERFYDFDPNELSASGVFFQRALEQQIINSILPKSLSGYFFFDTERVSDISTRKDLTDAVQGLLGLAPVANARKHLGSRTAKSSAIGYWNAALDLGGDERAKEAQATIESESANIELMQKQISNADYELEALNAQKAKIEETLRENQSTAELQRSKQNLEKKLKTVQTELEESNQLFMDSYNTTAITYFMLPLMDRAEKCLADANVDDRGLRGMTEASIRDIVKRGRCICGAKIEASDDGQTGNDAYMHILEELAFLPPAHIGTEIRNFKQLIETERRGIAQFYLLAEQQYKEIQKKRTEIANTEDQIARIDDSIFGKENMSSYEADLTRIKENMKAFQEIKASCNQKIGASRNAIESAQKVYDGLVTASERNQKLIRYLAYAEKICEWIDESYAEREQQMRNKLQERVNEIFGQMYHGQRRVQIDKQYHVTLFSQVNGKEIITGESEGLKRVKNFAFIAGLVDLAKEKAIIGRSAADAVSWENEAYPLVMDAPFSNADETHIKNISTVLPAVANQVIMFVMEKDWQYAEPVMAGRVGKYCKLKKFSESYTKIEE